MGKIDEMVDLIRQAASLYSEWTGAEWTGWKQELSDIFDILVEDFDAIIQRFYVEDSYQTISEKKLGKMEILKEFGGPFKVKLARYKGELCKVSLEYADGSSWYMMRFKADVDADTASRVIELELKFDDLIRKQA
jgi:hypothetical protein